MVTNIFPSPNYSSDPWSNKCSCIYEGKRSQYWKLWPSYRFVRNAGWISGTIWWSLVCFTIPWGSWKVTSRSLFPSYKKLPPFWAQLQTPGMMRLRGSSKVTREVPTNLTVWPGSRAGQLSFDPLSGSVRSPTWGRVDFLCRLQFRKSSGQPQASFFFFSQLHIPIWWTSYLFCPEFSYFIFNPLNCTTHESPFSYQVELSLLMEVSSLRLIFFFCAAF